MTWSLQNTHLPFKTKEQQQQHCIMVVRIINMNMPFTLNGDDMTLQLYQTSFG